MLRPLRTADAASCGGKAAALGTLLRAGLPVPDGLVLPFGARPETCGALDAAPAEQAEPWQEELATALAACGDPPVAIRSSAADEDTHLASAAGQYESVLGVRGAAAVGGAVRRCWDSARTARVTAYRSRLTGVPATEHAAVAVIVQRLVDAEASGVMFTATERGGPTRIEASWGLGPAVVGGRVSPDSWQVWRDRPPQVQLGHKATRVDRRAGSEGLVTTPVPPHLRDLPAIDESTARSLAHLGEQAVSILGGPQDIEWAVAGGTVWLLQSRLITATAPPPSQHQAGQHGRTLTGSPGAHGSARGRARVLHTITEAGRVGRGDIVVCRYTDPAWTPLFRIAGGIVTETGGVLSHAAIVAREHGIPAVLGVPDATASIPDGSVITIDGTAGSITLATR